MTDERNGIEREDEVLPQVEAERVRRPYAPPQLIEYGTVAKLTQTGGGSVFDFGGMMRMMTCL